ncbi:MAG: hypothetical protein ABIJ34_07420 [archaeon]
MKKLFFALIFIMIYLVAKPLLLFIVPGIFVWKLFPKKENSEKAIYVAFISISFWIVSFWILKILPISMLDFFNIVIALCFCSLLIWYPMISFKKRDLIIIGIFFIIIIARCLPFIMGHFPSGADTSFHVLTTKTIVTTNGFPEKYSIIPLPFGGYPIGFHIFSAYISLVSGIPEYKSVLLLSNLSYALLSLAVFVFLRRYFSDTISLAGAALVPLIANNPQFFISWGGNPFVFSLSILFVGISLLEDKKLISLADSLVIGLVFCASFIAHLTPAYVYLYIYLIWYIYSKKYLIRSSLKSHLVLALICILLLMPFILSYETRISPDEITFSEERQDTKFLSWKGTWQDSVLTIPNFINYLFGPILITFCLLGLLFMFTGKKLLSKIVVYFSVIFILILSSRYKFIPISDVLFSERTAMILLLPLSILFCEFLANITNRKLTRNLFPDSKLAMPVLLSIVIAYLFFVSATNYQHYLRISDTYSMVTPDDLDAFSWILNNTDSTDYFITNYGDAGLWLPVLTDRPALQMQLPPMYLDEFNEFQEKQVSKYIFFGSKKVYECDLRIEDYKSDEYEIVYSKKGVTIFKIKQ